MPPKSMSVKFRTSTVTILAFWDSYLQERLGVMANALAQRYGDDADLSLVYVPQMTGNGVEGHFNGNTAAELMAQGMTADLWISACKQAAKTFAEAFPNKAVAFECHSVLDSADTVGTIINDLWNDPTLGQRVGAALWWIRGHNDYETAMLDVLRAYPGDIYAQPIAKSSEPTKFGNSDYRTVFEQAKELGVRYIEVWNYEFENNTFPAEFADFNQWADANFQ